MLPARGESHPCIGTSKVLLLLPLLVHGIQDGLPLGMVTHPKAIDIPLHVLVKVRHVVHELFIGETLEESQVPIQQGLLKF